MHFLVSSIVTDSKKITFGDFGDISAILWALLLKRLGFSKITVNLVDYGWKKLVFM